MGLFDNFDDDPEHVLKIDGNGGWTDYRFESTGRVYPEQVNGHDEVGEKYVQGHVGRGVDIIGFDGAPKGIGYGNVDDHNLYLDGQRVWPFHLQMRELRVEGNADPTPYSFSVSESGKIIGTGSTTGEDHTLVSDTEARGRVNDGGADVWRYAGLLQGFDTNREGDDSPGVFVDDQRKAIEGNAPIGIVNYDG